MIFKLTITASVLSLGCAVAGEKAVYKFLTQFLSML